MNNEPDHPTVSLNIQTLLDERHALKERGAYQPSGSGQWIGPFKGARRGHSSEFDDLRHYSLGDDARHIDWKASARTNVVHTRLYREEREYRTTLIVDMRDAVFTGTTELQAVRLCRLAARLLWQANDGGSRTQVLVVTDNGLGLSESGSGHKSAIDACALMARLFESVKSRLINNRADRRETINRSSGHANTRLSDSASQIANTDDALLFLPNKSNASDNESVRLEQVAEWMLQQNGKHATALWISAFDHCGLRFDEHISLLSEHSNQIAIVVDDDVMEGGLPAGQYRYQAWGSASLTNDSTIQNINRIATLSRKASNKLADALRRIKNDRDARLRNLMMPSFHLNNLGENLIASLRHQGYLP